MQQNFKEFKSQTSPCINLDNFVIKNLVTTNDNQEKMHNMEKKSNNQKKAVEEALVFYKNEINNNLDKIKNEGNLSKKLKIGINIISNVINDSGIVKDEALKALSSTPRLLKNIERLSTDGKVLVERYNMWNKISNILENLKNQSKELETIKNAVKDTLLNVNHQQNTQLEDTFKVTSIIPNETELTMIKNQYFNNLYKPNTSSSNRVSDKYAKKISPSNASNRTPFHSHQSHFQR